MMSAWLQAMRADGPLSCYRGFSVAVTSMAAYKALYFGLYDTAKSILLPEVRTWQAGCIFCGCLFSIQQVVRAGARCCCCWVGGVLLCGFLSNSHLLLLCFSCLFMAGVAG